VMLSALLRTPMNTAELSLFELLLPDTTNEPSKVVPLNACTFAEKEPDDVFGFDWICRPAPAIGELKLRTRLSGGSSAPPNATQSSLSPGAKLPFHPHGLAGHCPSISNGSAPCAESVPVTAMPA